MTVPRPALADARAEVLTRLVSAALGYPAFERSAEQEAALAAERAEAEEGVPREPFIPEAHQRPPAGEWDTWLLMAGRGSGKTAAAAAYVNAEAMKAPIRIGIVAPTLGDAVESCVTGVSGLQRMNPDVRLRHGLGGTYVVWPNGSRAKLFGAHGPEDVERLRAGGNRDLDWYEEFAAWRHGQEAHDQAQLGLRRGPHPRRVVSTTPKARKHLLNLLAEPNLALTTATTDDNPHLEPTVRARLYAAYAGTRLGRQELGGELLADIEGALWTLDTLDAGRVDAAPPYLHRVAVGVDPAGSGGEDRRAGELRTAEAGGRGPETGIVSVGVAWIGSELHGYILGDASLRGGPADWGAAVVAEYERRRADVIVGEVNYGGEMVKHVVATSPGGLVLPFEMAHATRGKAVRAEPVANLSTHRRLHVVGSLPLLEAELTGWVPGMGWSPNRLDALVWAVTVLMLTGEAGVPLVGASAERRDAPRP